MLQWKYTSKRLFDFGTNPNKATLAFITAFLDWFCAIDNLTIKRSIAKIYLYIDTGHSIFLWGKIILNIYFLLYVNRWSTSAKKITQNEKLRMMCFRTLVDQHLLLNFLYSLISRWNFHTVLYFKGYKNIYDRPAGYFH